MPNRYTTFKIFHFKEKLDSLPRECPAILPPLHIRLKPTNVCNHRCRYCAYLAPDLQLGTDMVVRDSIPRDKMREIVSDMGEMGVRAVTFSGGGEPLCYPHITETISSLAARHIKIACLTNGSLLRGEAAELLAQHGSWVRVSIDGYDGESYAAYRNVSRDEFGKVISNMTAFAGRGSACLLGVALIIDRNNAGQVYAFTQRMKDIGVKAIKLSPCIVSNLGKENNEYHQPIFGQVRDQVQKVLAELAGPGFEVFDAYHALEEKFQKDYTWCPYLQIVPVIGADCNLYTCHDKAYNLKNGLVFSLKNQRLKEAWHAGKDQFFRINPSRDCNHHCAVNRANKQILEYLEVDRDHLDFV